MASITISGREIPALYIAVALPVVAAAYLGYAWFAPDDGIGKRVDDISNKEAGLEAKRNEAKELKQRTKQVDQVQAEMEGLNKSIVLLKQSIPTDAQVPVLLFDLERMAKSSSNAMSSFQPGPLRAYTPDGQAPAANGQAPPAAGVATSATGDIQELPVTIKATGTYPEVIRFLEQLASYERKLNVSNLSLTPAGEAKATASAGAANSGKDTGGFRNTLNVDFTLLAYVLKSPDAAPQAAPANPAARRRLSPKAGG